MGAPWVRSATGGSPALSPQPKNDFRWMGQLMAMLGMLCQDPDAATQHSSLEGLGHLYCLLLRQRGEPRLWQTHPHPIRSLRQTHTSTAQLTSSQSVPRPTSNLNCSPVMASPSGHRPDPAQWHPWPAEAPKAKTPAPEQLPQASEDEAPLWSSGDQEATPPASQEVAFQKDQIFQLGSSQVIKVKALRTVGRSGWGRVVMLCSDPHRHSL